LGSPAAPIAAADEPCGRKYCAGAASQDYVVLAESLAGLRPDRQTRRALIRGAFRRICPP
jgi:hypothetical protein